MNDRMTCELLEGVEVLDIHECVRLLHEGAIGCLGLQSTGAPKLRPVNYVIDGRLIVIRTGSGQILDAGRDGLPASFQISGINALEHTGWSVLVSGKLCQLESDAHNLALPLRPWASGQKDCFVGLSLESVSGRRIPPGRGNR